MTTYTNKYNLDLYQGTNFNLSLTLTNADGTPTDLTNAQVVADAKRTYSDAARSFGFDYTITDNVITLLMDKEATYVIPVDPAESVEQTPTIYCYDVIIHWLTSGEMYKVIYGNVNVWPLVSET